MPPLQELRESLPHRWARALAGVTEPADLWQAEAAWWDRAERDEIALVRTSALDFSPVLGAAAVLAASAR